MIQTNLLAYPKSAVKPARRAGVMPAILTAIADTKLVGRDHIDVKFIYGESVTDWFEVNVRDFLHFGHFVLALRTAMDNGLLPENAIDQNHLRKSWEPRSALVERKLCNPTTDCN